MSLTTSHDQFGLTKGIRIAEKMVILAIFWHTIWQPPMVLVAKKVEKMIKIFQIFFFQKIKLKTGLETQFHQKCTKTRDFSSITARHEKSTVPENGPYSSFYTQAALYIFTQVVF